MSAPVADTAEKGSAYLEQLKQAAEAQMRRPAPPLPAPKKHKPNESPGSATAADGADTGHSSDVEGGGEATAAERVGRYSYTAADAVVAGCSGFIGMCDFKRSNSATKEMLDILKAVLPGGVKLQLVKVGCRGLVVIMLQQQHQGEQQQAQEGEQQQPEDASQHQPEKQQQPQQQQQDAQADVHPAAVVAEVLARMESGTIQRPRFCQRIAPVETTCAMAASALEAAVKEVMSSYVTTHCSSSTGSSDDQQQQQGSVQFAVLFKNRDSTAPKATQARQTNQQQKQQEVISRPAVQQQQQFDASERLDKSRAINIAVAAVQECCKELGGAKVNLSQPQVVVMLEVLPLVGQQACAVSALPGSLMVTRPKLCVKPAAVVSGGGK